MNGQLDAAALAGYAGRPHVERLEQPPGEQIRERQRSASIQDQAEQLVPEVGVVIGRLLPPSVTAQPKFLLGDVDGEERVRIRCAGPV